MATEPSNVDLNNILKSVHNALALARFQPGFLPSHEQHVIKWAADQSVAMLRADPAKTRAWYEEGIRLEAELRYLGVERSKIWIAAGVGAVAVLAIGWLLRRR